jgi:tetratricopeptide (TPR) repeat protein
MENLYSDPVGQLAQVDEEDVSLLYWTGATWLARISKSKEDMESIGALPIAAAFIKRGLELDEDWGKGSLHDLAVMLEPSLPMPGGLERARKHYERALELADGTLASPYVSLATSVSVVDQNREEFVQMMELALAVDPHLSPDDQLANMYAQEQARYYLEHLDDLFVE